MHRVTRWWHSVVGLDKFGPLLAFLLASFLLSGATQSGRPSLVVIVLNVASLVAGTAATDLSANRPRMAMLLVVAAVSGVLVGVFDQASVAGGLGALGQAFALGGITLAVVRRILAHDHVGLPTITGAIAAYFLIGLVFAWIYLATYGFFTPPILDPEETGVPAYYSFVVLTTLGFGDVSPVHEFVRRLTAFEAVIGQIFLATLVARLVSMYGPHNRER